MAEDAGLGGVDEIEELREQDRFLPIANISRIMKKSLPDNAKIAKDAKETVQVRTVWVCVLSLSSLTSLKPSQAGGAPPTPLCATC